MCLSIFFWRPRFPMHWIVLLTPMPHKPIAIVAILTIYHNLQYHRLIWFHNKKYTAGGPGVPPVSHREDAHATTELRSKVRRGRIHQPPSALLYRLRNSLWLDLSGAKTVSWLHEFATTILAASQSFPTQLGISFLWGYAFIHYYLDSKIWRVRRDPSVGKALNMA